MREAEAEEWHTEMALELIYPVYTITSILSDVGSSEGRREPHLDVA